MTCYCLSSLLKAWQPVSAEHLALISTIHKKPQSLIIAIHCWNEAATNTQSSIRNAYETMDIHTRKQYSEVERFPVQPGDGWWWLGGRGYNLMTQEGFRRQITWARMGMFEDRHANVGSQFGGQRIKKINPTSLSPKQFPPTLRPHPERQTTVSGMHAQRSYDGTIFTGRYALDVFRQRHSSPRWAHLHISIFFVFLFLHDWIHIPNTGAVYSNHFASSQAFQSPQCAELAVSWKAPQSSSLSGPIIRNCGSSKQDFRRVVDGNR